MKAYMLQFVIVSNLFISSFAYSVDENITPLYQGAYNGNPVIVEYLLDTGADHELKSKSGYTAYDFASIKNNLAVLDVLKLYEKEKK